MFSRHSRRKLFLLEFEYPPPVVRVISVVNYIIVRDVLTVDLHKDSVYVFFFFLGGLVTKSMRTSKIYRDPQTSIKLV